MSFAGGLVADHSVVAAHSAVADRGVVFSASVGRTVVDAAVAVVAAAAAAIAVEMAGAAFAEDFRWVVAAAAEVCQGAAVVCIRLPSCSPRPPCLAFAEHRTQRQGPQLFPFVCQTNLLPCP